MTLKEWSHKVLEIVLPWPARSDRKSAIEDAKSEREKSERARIHAQKLEQQLQRMMKENHFAQKIAESLMRGIE